MHDYYIEQFMVHETKLQNYEFKLFPSMQSINNNPILLHKCERIFYRFTGVDWSEKFHFMVAVLCAPFVCVEGVWIKN